MRDKKIFILIVLLLLLNIISSLVLSKTTTIKEYLTEEFFDNDTNIIVERINGSNFEEINLPDNYEEDLVAILEKVKFKTTKVSHSPLDAEFRIYTKENQLYLFVDEGVIVFPNESGNAYKVINNADFMERIEEILQ